MKKNLIRYSLFALVIISLFIIWGFSLRYKMSQVCKDVRVEITNEEQNYFIGIENLRTHLQEILYNETVDSRIVPKTMGEINLHEVERILEANPFIRNAEVFRRNGGVLEVKVELRKAIARIQNVAGEIFYLDEEGKIMPLTPAYTPNVILVSGKILESPRAGDTLRTKHGKDLYDLLKYVNTHDFFKAQISEILMDREGNLTFFPEAGSMRVEFGPVHGYEEKMENLLLFYKQVLARTGWDRYRKISVKFKGQVVAEKRNPNDPDISEY